MSDVLAADRTAIAQLLARYCHVVDDADWDALVTDIFAPDGSMAVAGRHDPHVGADALRELYGVKMNHPVAHHSTSVVIDRLGDDDADVRSKWITVRADGTVGTGVYVDHLVRTDHGWRIAQRVANPGM